MSRINQKTEEEEEKRRSRSIFFTNYLQTDERVRQNFFSFDQQSEQRRSDFDCELFEN